jgi:hypothetical protein
MAFSLSHPTFGGQSFTLIHFCLSVCRAGQTEIILNAGALVSADFLPIFTNFTFTKRNRRAAKQKRSAMQRPLAAIVGRRESNVDYQPRPPIFRRA